MTVGQHIAVHRVREAILVEHRGRLDHLGLEGLVESVECLLLTELGDLGGRVEREGRLEQRPQSQQRPGLIAQAVGAVGR